MPTAQEAKFRLSGYKIPEFFFKESSFPESSKIDINFDAYGEFESQKRIYILTLEVTINTDTGITNNIEELIKIKAIGYFEFAEIIEELPDYFFSNSIAILFPYIRAFISTLTLQANLKLVLLPTLNLSHLNQVLKENTRFI